MRTVIIRPHRYQQFGRAERDTNFYLITDSPESFTIEQDGSYHSCQILVYSDDKNFLELIEQTQEPAHVLVICPNHFISSIEPQQISQRKLAIMAANSAPTSIKAIEHFAKVVENTDPLAQKEFADRFFSLIEQSDFLRITDEEYKVSATFSHFDDEHYEWFEQGGYLDWGCQQLAPSGELSVLPLAHGQFDFQRKLAINGEIALRGFPILHSGKPSFLAADQARIYGQLSVLKEHAVLAKVENGMITQLDATHPSVEAAKAMLEMMFAVDSRYAQIWELGFGINTALDIWDDNTAMNEVYGGENGVLHFGIGLTPFTQYHLDIICPSTKVLTNKGELLIGSSHNTRSSNSSKKIVRHTVSICPCDTQSIPNLAQPLNPT